MKKIVQNWSTEESREFWLKAERGSEEIDTWPDWKRAGINVSQLRTEARLVPDKPALAPPKK